MDLVDKIQEVERNKYTIKNILETNKVLETGMFENNKVIAIKINNRYEQAQLEKFIIENNYSIISLLSTVHMCDVQNADRRYPLYVVISIIHDNNIEFNKCTENSIIRSSTEYKIIDINDIKE